MESRSDATIATIMSARLFALLEEIVGDDGVSTRDFRAMLGVAVLNHLMEEYETREEMLAALNLFHAEVRVRIKAIFGETKK